MNRFAVRVVSLAVLLLCAPAALFAQPATGWRMDGFNGQRRNASNVPGPQTVATVQVLANNVVVPLRRSSNRGTLIFADGNIVQAIDATGQQKWLVTVQGGRDVAVGPEGNVYVSDATTLSGLHENTGNLLWTPYVANNGNESGGLVITNDGTVLFHTGNSLIGGFGERLSAMNPDGSIKWEVSLNFRGYTHVVLSPDEQFAYVTQHVSINGTAFTVAVPINVATGAVLSRALGACDFQATPLAFGSALITFEGGTTLTTYSADLQSCDRIHTAVAGEVFDVAALPPTGEAILFVNTFSGFGLSRIAPNGSVVWSSGQTKFLANSFFQRYSVFAADSLGTLYAVSADRRTVFGIRGSDGQVLWTAAFADDVSGLLVGGAGVLYLSVGSQLVKLTGAIPEEVCGNGVDDDGDGQIDEGCTPPAQEVCGNGIDDDGDGLVDEGCAPASGPAHITLSSTVVAFSAVSGEAAPAGKSFTIGNSGGAILHFTAVPELDWCRLTPASDSIAPGTSNAYVVSVDPPSNVGTFTCRISIVADASDNSPQNIAVEYRVTALQVVFDQPATFNAKPQKLIGRETVLWESFAIQMQTLFTLHQDSLLDVCSIDTVDAARQGSRIQFGNAALRQLASGIFSASVPFNLGSAFATFLLKTGTYLVAETAFGGTPLSPFLLTKAVTESTVGYILGASIGTLAADLLSKPLTDKLIERAIKEAGAVYATGDGLSPQSGTRVRMSLAYSPTTSFVVATVGSTCSSDRYIFRYQVDEHAVRRGPLTMLVVSPTGQRFRHDF